MGDRPPLCRQPSMVKFLEESSERLGRPVMRIVDEHGKIGQQQPTCARPQSMLRIVVITRVKPDRVAEFNYSFLWTATTSEGDNPIEGPSDLRRHLAYVLGAPPW